MPPAEKRRSLRRAINYPAYIDLGDGSPFQECALSDASQEGAQLTVSEPDALPERFILALSADGAALRKCKVVWRTGNQIGVEFLKDSKKVANSPPKRFAQLAAHSNAANPVAAETPAA